MDGSISPETRCHELSGEARADLEQIVRDGPASVARRARIILERADGSSLATIARNAGLHRDSVRRWLKRYQCQGVTGLRHGNAGKARNVVFGDAVRDEIHRRASLPPVEQGENFRVWSLYKLRDHLVDRGVVETISVERLRQLLAVQPVSRQFWRPGTQLLPPLSAEARQRLAELAHTPQGNQARRARAVLAIAEGATVASVATALRLSRNSVRRWLDHFRLGGTSALASRREPPPHTPPTQAVRSPATSPAALYMSNPGERDR